MLYPIIVFIFFPPSPFCGLITIETHLFSDTLCFGLHKGSNYYEPCSFVKEEQSGIYIVKKVGYGQQRKQKVSSVIPSHFLNPGDTMGTIENGISDYKSGVFCSVFL